MPSLNLQYLAPTLQIVSTASATFLSGYHYGSDKVALPSLLSSSSLSAADLVRGWFRAWDVGRIVGPLCVNVSLLGNAILAYHEGIDSPSFWLHVTASGAQVINVLYTVFGVFRLNDKLLDAYSALKEKRELNNEKEVREWVREWQRMDWKRMWLMYVTATAGFLALWKRI